MTSKSGEERVAKLEDRLGVPLTDKKAALRALTHKSYANEHRADGLRDNERLEFLGDAVIDLAVSDRLMRIHPEAREGELSKLRAAIVSEEGLCAVARTIGLGELLLLGRGEEMTGGRDKESLLADTFEAVIGAVYLGGGMQAALTLVDRFFGKALESAGNIVDRDHKTSLQEKVQERFKSWPQYRIVCEQGQDHLKVFSVEVLVAGEVLGCGEGRSKKDAEQAAAKKALQKLASCSRT